MVPPRPWIVAVLALLILVPMPVMAQDRPARDRAAADDARLGPFTAEDGTITGAHVAFTIDRERGRLIDYTVDGVLLYDALWFDPPRRVVPRATPDGHGMALVGAGFAIAFYDDPAAPIRFDTRRDVQVQLRIDPADGFTPRAIDRRAFALHGEDAVITARTPEGHAVLADGTVAIRNVGVLRLMPERPALDRNPELRDRLANAFEHGRLGAEVTVARAGAAGQVAAYDNITVALDAAVGTLKAVVSAQGLGGRTLVFHVDAGLLPGARLEVRMDGTPIRQASGLIDVLDPDDDGLDAEWFAVATDTGTVVLLSVPHFSERTFEIQALDVIPAAARPVIGAIAAAIVVGGATVMLLRGRKDDDL